eukprot:1149497-Pelagomonas_calceolata.AAC.2
MKLLNLYAPSHSFKLALPLALVLAVQQPILRACITILLLKRHTCSDQGVIATIAITMATWPMQLANYFCISACTQPCPNTFTHGMTKGSLKPATIMATQSMQLANYFCTGACTQPCPTWYSQTCNDQGVIDAITMMATRPMQLAKYFCTGDFPDPDDWRWGAWGAGARVCVLNLCMAFCCVIDRLLYGKYD